MKGKVHRLLMIKIDIYFTSFMYVLFENVYDLGLGGQSYAWFGTV